MERKKLTLKIMLFFIVFSSYTILHKPSIQYKFNNEGKNALKWDEREGKKVKVMNSLKLWKRVKLTEVGEINKNRTHAGFTT